MSRPPMADTKRLTPQVLRVIRAVSQGVSTDRICKRENLTPVDVARIRFPECDDEFLDWWVRSEANGPLLQFIRVGQGIDEWDYLSGAVSPFEPADFTDMGRERAR